MNFFFKNNDDEERLAKKAERDKIRESKRIKQNLLTNEFPNKLKLHNLPDYTEINLYSKILDLEIQNNKLNDDEIENRLDELMELDIKALYNNILKTKKLDTSNFKTQQDLVDCIGSEYGKRYEELKKDDTEYYSHIEKQYKKEEPIIVPKKDPIVKPAKEPAGFEINSEFSDVFESFFRLCLLNGYEFKNLHEFRSSMPIYVSDFLFAKTTNYGVDVTVEKTKIKFSIKTDLFGPRFGDKIFDYKEISNINYSLCDSGNFNLFFNISEGDTYVLKDVEKNHCALIKAYWILNHLFKVNIEEKISRFISYSKTYKEGYISQRELGDVLNEYIVGDFPYM